MKKNLRLLCLSLAAATAFCSFAQENNEPKDMTSSLKNADMEQGLKGWSFDGVDVMGKNKKAASVKIGFHGMSEGVQEAWHSNVSNPLGDSYTMQRLSSLPSGTYVFGAYAAAAKQHNRNDICERVTKNGKEEHVLVDKKHQYSDWWSNRDSIYGVALFANDATVRVATDNPDLSERGQFWGHSSKFNVAVSLTEDEVLNVGMRVINTNANYIVWDNATLYYFGDMSEAEALDAMAEIDMTKAAAIADTLTGLKMNADSLLALQGAIGAAESKTSTAASLWNDSKELHQAAGLARRSITDYANLKKNIESAAAVAEDPFYLDGYTKEDYLPLLEGQLAKAEDAYEAADLNRAELTALRNELNYYVGALRIDSIYAVQEELSDFIEALKDSLGLPGGYTVLQQRNLEAFAKELEDTLAYFEDEWGEEYNDELFNPNNLYPYIARTIEVIENVKNNRISDEYAVMPIEFAANEDNFVNGTETYKASEQIVAYTSPLYRFKGKVTNFVITVKKANHGGRYFCLSELEFYDMNGQKIALDEKNLTTNADHMANHPDDEGQGGGLPALFDGDVKTFFHSEWKNDVGADHYLEVTLPGGGYDAFSFKMVSRGNHNGHDQRRTFPAEMIISAPMPEREALEQVLEQAKAKHPYSSKTEIGFYIKDFSYLTDEIAKVEAALEGWPTEDECKAMASDLNRQINKFEADEDKDINVPSVNNEGKVEVKSYRFIAALPGYYEQQGVEKAMTMELDTLQWKNVDADNKNQEFKLVPILEAGEPYFEENSGTNNDGSTWKEVYYCYTLQAADGRFLEMDTVSRSVPVSYKLVESTKDTVRLKSIGAGQWNIIVKSKNPDANQLHTDGHGNGGGKGAKIVAWNGGLNSASAWFICEMPELPLNVLVSGEEFKSDFYHFEAANTITLTADKDCKFENLALYDVYGKSIAIDSLVVAGKTATITAKTKDYVGCAFAFTNSEDVKSVEFNAFQFVADMTRLQKAYDAAVLVAPEEGTAVMQYADITEYTKALEAAEEMLEGGAAETAAVDAMIKKLEDVVAALVPNMPEADKYYFILSGLPAFEENHSYNMALYTKEAKLYWAQENESDWRRYWQFEAATKDELEELKVKDAADVKAFYIKNVATGKYIGKAAGNSTHLEMASSKSETVPYTITALQGSVVAIAGVNNAGHRLHGAGHGEGANKNGSVVYWNSGLGSSSAWTIVEAQYDATDIDFTEVEDENKAVVKGTFDLFGRRVVAPTAPGIYIIDGKKKVIK